MATALYLFLALPGLIFGFLLKVAPLGLPCDSSGGFWGLDTWGSVTSGEPCRTIDYTTLYWLLPAVAPLDHLRCDRFGSTCGHAAVDD